MTPADLRRLLADISPDSPIDRYIAALNTVMNLAPQLLDCVDALRGLLSTEPGHSDERNTAIARAEVALAALEGVKPE